MSLPKGKLLFRLFTTPGLTNNDGVGDYKPCEYVPGAWDVYTSEFQDNRANILILIHELIELILTQHRGISEPEIAEFDRLTEERIDRGDLPENTSPGDLPEAPYFNEHRFATNIEMYLCKELGWSWDEYEKYWQDTKANMRCNTSRKE